MEEQKTYKKEKAHLQKEIDMAKVDKRVQEERHMSKDQEIKECKQVIEEQKKQLSE
jgi:hypothetical protein